MQGYRSDERAQLGSLQHLLDDLMRDSRQRCSWRTATLALVVILPNVGWFKPEIRGDAELLDSIVSALRTNQHELRQGSCHMVFTSHNSATDTEAQIDLLWQEGSSHSSYSYREYDHEANRERAARGSQIVANGLWTVYTPEARLCETFPQRADVNSFRYACPPDICFHMAHIPSFPYTKFFEDWENGAAIELEQSGDIIRVKLIPTEEGHMLMEFSLSHGCNVQLWELYDGNRTLVAWQRQEWQQVEDVWYPAVSEHDWRGETLRIEITNFNPHPEIHPDQFLIASLELPQGTSLIERDETGRTIKELGYVGSRNHDEQQDLEALVEEARTNGFANPERER